MGNIIALYILLGILAFLTFIALLVALILSMRISLHIKYEKELEIYYRIFFKKSYIYPEPKEKFSAGKQKTKQITKQVLPTRYIGDIVKEEGLKATPAENINLIVDILKVFIRSCLKYLHVKLAKVHIKVATGDAAKTAITYGAVSGAVACLVDAIDEITNLDRIKDASISVEPDFLSGKSEYNINIKLSISLFGYLVSFGKFAFRYAELKDRLIAQKKAIANAQAAKESENINTENK